MERYSMSELPFQFKFKEAGVGMAGDREDLDEREVSMQDCWNITSDIKNILDVSENIEDDVRALMKVYNIKFKVLANNVDEVDNNLIGLRETWEEMRPDKWQHPDTMTEHWEEEQLEMFEEENVGCQ